jgi:hypothetical protein
MPSLGWDKPAVNHRGETSLFCSGFNPALGHAFCFYFSVIYEGVTPPLSSSRFLPKLFPSRDASRLRSAA